MVLVLFVVYAINFSLTIYLTLFNKHTKFSLTDIKAILRSIDSGSITVLTMLDLSAAFDTIDHSTLLNRLSVNFGISGTALTLFSSYLTERSQSVLIEGNYSSDFNLMYGVPQGSVLGPILFTMFVYATFRQHFIIL